MPTPRKIVQLLTHRNVLVALTDTSEIWMLHGLDAMNSGTDGQGVQWTQLLLALPPVPDPLPLVVPTEAGPLEPAPEVSSLTRIRW